MYRERTSIVHCEYMALANKTSVLREAMCLFVEPAWSAVNNYKYARQSMRTHFEAMFKHTVFCWAIYSQLTIGVSVQAPRNPSLGGQDMIRCESSKRPEEFAEVRCRQWRAALASPLTNHGWYSWFSHIFMICPRTQHTWFYSVPWMCTMCL